MKTAHDGNQQGRFAQRMGRLGPDALMVAGLLILVLLFFWRFLTPKPQDRVAFPAGDFTDQFYAWRVYTARELTAGRIPLWNPYYNSGHPFLADSQSAVFYPIALAFTLLASREGQFPLFALHLEAFLHFFLAGAFTYFFARRLLAGRLETGCKTRAPIIQHAPALIAALTFTFGGYLASYPPLQLAILETITWLPLVLLCLDIAAQRGTVGPLLATGAVVGMAALAGHPQTLLLVAYTGAFYYAFRAWEGKGKHQHLLPWAAKLGLRLATVLAVAFGLAAIQLVPALEYASLSTRASLNYVESSRGMPPLDLLQVILPGSISPFMSPLYVGILPLWLGITAVMARRDGPVVFWAILALLALLISFGGYAFPYSLFYLFAPGFALFRGQERATGIFSFALAILAGHGAALLMHPLSRRQKAVFLDSHRLLQSAPWLGLIITLAFFYATRSLPQPGSFIFLVDRAALMTLIYILVLAVVTLRLWGRVRAPIGMALMILVVLFDLFTINWFNNQGRPTERFPLSPLVQTLQRDAAAMRIDGQALPGHGGVVYGLADIRGVSPMRLKAYDDLLHALPEERLWSLLNVGFLVTRERPSLAGVQEVLRNDDAILYRLPEPLPRAWIAGQVMVEPSGDRALALLASPNFDPAQTVILAEPPQAMPSPGARGTARVTIHEPEYIAIEAKTSANAFLVVSEIYFPGWQAKVDGQETRLYRADHTLRAVFLAAGEHRVEMIYEPASFRLGVGLSLITLLGVGGYALARWRRRG